MTERTGWKRPDYKVLHETGELNILDGTSTSKQLSQQGETDNSFQDIEHDTSAASSNGSSSSSTITSLPIEAGGAASSLNLSNSGLPLADTSSESISSPTDEEFLSPLTNISNIFSHLTLLEPDNSLPQVTEEVVDTVELIQTIEYIAEDIPVEPVADNLEAPLESAASGVLPVEPQNQVEASLSGGTSQHPQSNTVEQEALTNFSSSVGVPRSTQGGESSSNPR